MKESVPTDDKPGSVAKRMLAVYEGKNPTMPRLASMTKKEMAKNLQDIWTLLDETGIQRRNETSPKIHLSIYGRVYDAIVRGPIPPSDYGKKRIKP